MTRYDSTLLGSSEKPPPRKSARKPWKQPAEGQVSTRDVAKIVTWYIKHVRFSAPAEMRGIFRQILLLTSKGINLAQISQAIQHYAADPWVKGQPQDSRHHIRKFMMAERITRWERATPAVDPSIAALTRLAEHAGIQEKAVDPLQSDRPGESVPDAVEAEVLDTVIQDRRELQAADGQLPWD